MKRFILFFLMSAGTLLTLGVLEFVVRAKWPQRTYNEAKANSMRLFLSDSKQAFTTRPNVRLEFFGYTREFKSVVSTNSLGLRGGEVGKEKPSNTVRILVLGDSMTFGWGVNDEEAYAAQLARLLNDQADGRRYEVLNAGFTSGPDPGSEYLYLKEKGMRLKPDLVIVGIFPHNDMGDIGDSVWKGTNDKGVPERIESGSTRVDDSYLVSTEQPLRYRLPLLCNSHLWLFFMSFLEQGGWVRSAISGKDFSIPDCLDLKKCEGAYRRYRILLDAYKSLSKEKNVPVVFLFLPSPYWVEKGTTLMRSYEREAYETSTLSARSYDRGIRLGNFEPEKTLVADTKNTGLPVVDVLPDLTSRDWPEYFYKQDGHLTSHGHTKVAQALAAFLTPLLRSRIAL